MATKFSECVLGHAFRVRQEDGSTVGGPMYYMERGLAPRLGSAETLSLRARFYNGAGNHLAETPLAEDQQLRRINPETIEFHFVFYWFFLLPYHINSSKNSLYSRNEFPDIKGFSEIIIRSGLQTKNFINIF